MNNYTNNGVYILLPLRYTPCVYRLEARRYETRSNANATRNPNRYDDQIIFTLSGLSLVFSRICSNEQNAEFIRDLADCSDVVLQFPPPDKDEAWTFLNQFLIDQYSQYEINFSTFKISDWSEVNNTNSNPVDGSFEDRYAFQMLVSLGFVFQDKWAELTDRDLIWHKWNTNNRYAVCCFARKRLCEDHGYDLKQTLKDYNGTREELRRSDENTDRQTGLVRNKFTELLKVACCTLTPLKIIFQPLETTIGNRALRKHQSV